VNGNKLRQIFYPDPSSKSDDALGMNEEDRSLMPFPNLRCLLLGACYGFTLSLPFPFQLFIYLQTLVCMPYSCRSIALYHCVLLYASISQSGESFSFDIIKGNGEELRYFF